MTKIDVIRMAEECELFDGIWSHPELKELKSDKFIKFANLVAAIEREACARECEKKANELWLKNCHSEGHGADQCSVAIRARGNNDV